MRLRMEYIDVVFKGIKKENLDFFIKNIINITNSKVIRSHFYTHEKGDFEYSNEIDFNDYFSSAQTCNFLLSNLQLDKTYYDVLVIITADVDDVDVTVNIEQKQFNYLKRGLLFGTLKRIFQTHSMKAITVSSTCSTDPFINIKAT